MAHEIEVAAYGGLKPVLGRRPTQTLPVGTPCPNCATPLAGPWCHACGQSAEDYHRSLVRLTVEAVGGLLDVDSRLWRTLPSLFFNPARLTRDYLDGHRAAQAPPFRLFLIVVVVLFLAAGVGQGAMSGSSHPQALKLDGHSSINIDNDPAVGKWVTDRAKAAAARPEAFEASLATWAQRLVFLALPLSAALLGLMFFWRRGVFMFDHLIFSMHSLSFQGSLVTVMLLGENLSGWFGLLILASPVHLFVHLKGTYGLGVLGTLLRMLVLFLGSLVGFAVSMVGLVLIGLYEIGS